MEIYYHLFENMPDAVLLVGQRGIILKMNSQGEKLFGYNSEEYLARPVEMLIPQRFATTHPEQRSHYAADPKVRAMGAGIQVFARRKDGSEFPVDVMLSPLETAEGQITVAVSSATLPSENTTKRRKFLSLPSCKTRSGKSAPCAACCPFAVTAKKFAPIRAPGRKSRCISKTTPKPISATASAPSAMRNNSQKCAHYMEATDSSPQDPFPIDT